MKVLILGGGSSGTTTAFELRKLNKDVEITIIEKTNNLEYSPCALPYVISNEINDFENIILFNKKDYENNNIKLILNSEVFKIDSKNKLVYYKNNNSEYSISYDKLVLALGADNFIPDIPNLKNIDYYELKTIEQAKKIKNHIKKNSNSVIIGAGMIGVELAYSLSKQKENVTLLEAKENILPNLLDLDMLNILKTYLEENKIKIIQKANIKNITQKEITLNNDLNLKFDKLFVCTGIKPNISLLDNIDIKHDNGIIVNEYLQTSDKSIYTCGDIVKSIELNTDDLILSALGTTAVRQAKCVAKNILGQLTLFPKVMNNTITKIGELYIGSVGLTTNRAKQFNLNPISAKYTGTSQAEYYSSKDKITVKIIINKKGIIIGSQVIGTKEVVGRLNLIALAIQNKMHITKLATLETCYNPPSAPIYDPITLSAQILLKKLEFLNKKEL